MRSDKVLEMLNNGQIDELKRLLQDDIYQDSLKGKPTGKKRYAAMKRYFKYTDNVREVCQKPCRIEFEDKQYTSFTNSWSLALTLEDTGEIELFNTENGKYPDVTRLLRFDGIKRKIDFNKVIAEAKTLGYKLNKAEVGLYFKYLMLYDGTYYKIGLIDITHGIINDGNPIITYHPDGERMPLTFKNEIGIGMIMPVYSHDKESLENKIIIEIGDDY